MDCLFLFFYSCCVLFYAVFFSVTTGFVFTYLALQLHPLLEHDVNTNPIVATAIIFLIDIFVGVCCYYLLILNSVLLFNWSSSAVQVVHFTFNSISPIPIYFNLSLLIPLETK